MFWTTPKAVRFLVFLAIFLFVEPTTDGREAQPAVPGVMLFGDSLVGVGNNDYLATLVKANMAPYGRDFKDHIATGRFGNGKLLSDIIGEKLGFNGSPPAYLSPQASGQNLLIGANFASAGSGYYDPTARIYHVIPLSRQLEYLKEYQSKLRVVAGNHHAQSIISDSLYIISAGSNDFGFNYYINPLLFLTQNADQFSDRLVGIFNNTVTQLHAMGARRVGVFSLAPLGCALLAITVFGLGRNRCVPRLNDDAQRFNGKLSAAVDSLSNRYHDLKVAVLDIYTPWHSLATSPVSHGFAEARHGCCATGLVEFTVFLCNSLSIGTCPNATTYVHWDSIHPSEAANRVIVDSLGEGINKLVM
ncbi:GDSL esterase/lipase APG-like [Triticum dicoccoides]|uniref:GDSL esterase/lipase APG-like n=1 Tax=Triticum dicoccoides TaxID=85692 RepID=UPI001890E58D|nr:GDSL esterase/lipase APG-like [Triticum dicoccoides]